MTPVGVALELLRAARGALRVARPFRLPWPRPPSATGLLISVLRGLPAQPLRFSGFADEQAARLPTVSAGDLAALAEPSAIDAHDLAAVHRDLAVPRLPCDPSRRGADEPRLCPAQARALARAQTSVDRPRPGVLAGTSSHERQQSRGRQGQATQARWRRTYSSFDSSRATFNSSGFIKN